jgi:uncharacterized MAPEG superfamily protein
VVFRTLHGFFYLSDLPLFRSMAFAAGMLCTFGLFGIAAVA